MNTPPEPPIHKPLQIANPQPLDDQTLERRLKQREMERAIDGGDREYEREQARKNAINRVTITAIYVVPSLVGIMLLWIILAYLVQGRLDLALNVLIPIGSIIGGYIIRLVQEYTGKDS